MFHGDETSGFMVFFFLSAIEYHMNFGPKNPIPNHAVDWERDWLQLQLG
jgi:hypothetical protein